MVMNLALRKTGIEGIIQEIKPIYQKASFLGKGRILDELTSRTGYDRKVLVGKLNSSKPVQKIASEQINLTKEDAAYLAGIIDGEGSILITKHRIKKDGTRYSPVVSAETTSEELAEWIAERCGGVIHHRRPRATNFKKLCNPKEQFAWRCPTNRLESLLVQLEPFLLIKHKKALVLLDFLQEGTFYFLGGQKLPMTIQIKREELRQRIKSLN